MNNYFKGEIAYQTVKQRSAVACAYRNLIMDIHTNQETIDKLIKFIHNEAERVKRSDVIEDLQFAGLVYG